MNEANTGPSLSQIGQIAITVQDMKRAIAFYRDCLGLKFLFQAPNVAFFDCGGIRLMLGQNEHPAKQPSGTILYYKAVDLETTFAAIKQRGATVEREPHLVAKMPDHELWLAFLRDSEGNIVGLMCEKR